MNNYPQLPPRPPFWIRLSVTAGNITQAVGLLVGAALLYVAAHTDAADIIRIVLVILAWFVIYICAHSLGHYVIGCIIGIRFRGYGVRGTDRPESYGPGIRQMMSVLPTFTVMTEKSSMAKASPVAKALMFAAGGNLDNRLRRGGWMVCPLLGHPRRRHFSDRRDCLGNTGDDSGSECPERRLCESIPRPSRPLIPVGRSLDTMTLPPRNEDWAYWKH